MEKRIQYAQQANKEMQGYLQPSPQLNKYSANMNSPATNSLLKPHQLLSSGGGGVGGGGSPQSSTNGQYSLTNPSAGGQLSSNSLQSSTR